MPKVYNKRDPSCPKDAVYVGRPSKWGNPFKIGQVSVIHVGEKLNREQVIELYRQYLDHNLKLIADLHELRGKDLVCWCTPLPCHADVLLELANH
jgi:hypothetical protein